LQTVNVSLCKDAALACDRVQAHAGIRHLGQFFRFDAELGADFVDDCTGATGAFVIHGGDFFTSPAWILPKMQNFRVLAAQFNNGIDFGVQLFNGERECIDFLHKTCTESVEQRATA
jgi:hypothetical protein